MKRPRLLWPICLSLALSLPLFLLLGHVRAHAGSAAAVSETIRPRQRYTEHIPVIDIREFGYRPIRIPVADRTAAMVQQRQFQGDGGSDPLNPYALIRQTGSAFAAPGATVHFEITLANYESLTHTYRLTDTLPAELRYVPGSADGLAYDAKTQTLSWQGSLAPGNLDYLIEESSIAMPYLDLADFGAANLCDDFSASGVDCDEVAVTFNLGINGYQANLYGHVLNQLTLSSNGLLLSDDAAIPPFHDHNQLLPDAAAPGFLLAGLWRDADLGIAGARWHAAIIRGLLEGHDVFYGQWHNAPHADDPNLTARHAIAVVLDGPGLLSGHVFYIYDNISDPEQTTASGYTIGIEDRPGLRGSTFAYAPCCSDTHLPQGYPPASGTTLHLRPVLFGANHEYRRSFSFDATVNAQVPETVINTAYASSSSAETLPSGVWASHYMYIRLQNYLPFLHASGGKP